MKSKITGLKIIYFMRNGQTLEDTGLEFETSYNEADEELVDLIGDIGDMVKSCFKAGMEDCVTLGNIYVRASEIQAVKIEPIYQTFLENEYE